MRFIGLVLVLIAIAVGYFLGFRGLSFADARARLAQLLNLPGLAPSSAASAGTTPPAGAVISQLTQNVSPAVA